MANINKIRISGTSYDIQDSNAPKVVELTQAQYDALVDKDPNVFYIITDASQVDLSQYWTSAQTNTAISQATSGKTNLSDFTGHTADTSIHVTTAQTAAWDAKSNFSGDYNDLANKLSAGTNITIVDNVISATGGGGGGNANVVELTQAQYDALTTVDPDTIYVITDAQGGDLANYMTSAQTTSAITQAVSGKTDNSDFTAHTGNSEIHVTSAEKAAWNAKSDFSGSYNDLTNKLSAGTNVSIVDNVISAEGGGGKAVSGGTNISVTTGETADTINCTLNAKNGTGAGSIIFGNTANVSNQQFSVAFGSGTQAKGIASIAEGESTQTTAWYCHSSGYKTLASGKWSNAEGYQTTASTQYSHTEGIGTKVTNNGEHSQGMYNTSSSDGTTSGNTLFSVGNGTGDNARHNAFEIKQNGDIYITSGGTDIKLQDNLGGGGGGGTTYSAGTNIDITNDIISCTIPAYRGGSSNGISLNYNSNTASGWRSIAGGSNCKASSENAVALGYNSEATNDNAFAMGQYSIASGFCSAAICREAHATNMAEFACGQHNVSNKANDTFGNSGNTLFSVGNGTSDNAKHNAFEVRQNADIYFSYNGNDVKLQDKFSTIETTIGDINTILQSI